MSIKAYETWKANYEKEMRGKYTRAEVLKITAELAVKYGLKYADVERAVDQWGRAFGFKEEEPTEFGPVCP